MYHEVSFNMYKCDGAMYKCIQILIIIFIDTATTFTSTPKRQSMSNIDEADEKNTVSTSQHDTRRNMKQINDLPF